MNTGDWIQLGILIVYTLTLAGGGIIALLRLNHLIVDIDKHRQQMVADIEDRQRRIDVAAEAWRQQINDAEKKLIEIDWRSKFFLIGLILVNFAAIYLHGFYRQDGTNKK